MTAPRAPFGLLDPLPQGRLAIEASAGTGKTFTLAALATRYLAETDVTAGDLLIVTFTRAATTELRARVRDRVAQAAAHLAGDGPSDDALLTHLAATDRDRRRARLERAVTEFDAATISTIHGFAGQVIATLGSAGRADPDLALVSDDHDLAWEISADVLARAATQGHPAGDLPSLLALATLVKVQANTPDLLLTPTDDEPAATAAQHLLRELVTSAATAMAAHRRRAGTRSYGDLLTDLRDALVGGDGTAEAARTLRARYRVALIDEFQDTDPVQWDIFRRLFVDDLPATGLAGAPGASAPPSRAGSLVLVGDPKQAIYAFRGANVRTYVGAVAGGGQVRTLGTNWRSDGAVLQALEVLLAGTTFGDVDIAFSSVAAAPGHEDRRLRGPGGEPLPALSLRLALDPSLTRTTRGQLEVADAERAIYGDLVLHVRRLLEEARLPTEDDGDRPVRPSDIAVLVKTSAEANAIQAALVDQGIPAVLARGGSVLRSPAATQWRWLLEALARPSDPARARTFALSWFEGRGAAWVDAATDAELAEVQDRLHTWADRLAGGGVHELLRSIWAETEVVARVLARPDGDRSMTDLEHVAELLRTESTGRSSVAGLLAVLDSSPELDPDAEMEGDLASRRIESEAQAVQIMTVWVAKGLEFPIACCPTLWRKRNGDVLYQDPDLDRRALDLAKGQTWPDKAGAAARKRLAAAEREGEDLRLLYVALTRAKHQTVAWWTRAGDNDGTGLARVLFGRDPDGTLDPDRFAAAKIPLPDDALAAEALAPLVAAGAGTIEVKVHGRRTLPAEPWVDPVADAGREPLGLAALDRELDRTRRRWSFTAITAEADQHHEAVGAGVAADLDPDAPSGGTDEGEAPATDDELYGPDDLDGWSADAGPSTAAPLDGHGSAAAPPVPPVPAPPPEPEAGGQFSLFDAALVAADVAAPSDPPTGTADGSSSAQADEDPTRSPLASLPAGAAFGTLVHEVLEHVTFDAEDLTASVAEQVERQLAWRSFDLTPPTTLDPTPTTGRDLLVDGLVAVVDTPLGPLFDQRPLRSFAHGDRLDELSFELVLGEAGAVPTDAELGRTILDHLPAGDPYRPWAEQIAAGAFGVDLAGHLTGSIDAVLRVATPHRPDRFVVVDYKTNRLHDPTAPPMPADYRPEQLVGAMAEHHYPLQALLYAVALHRYLRWRIPGYDPAVHLGGAAYLFLRGMSGPGVATVDGAPHGVAAWSIPPALVTATSDLLHGRTPAEARS